ncbi:MAG TPA: cytochrome P450 [Myxococcales bacterium]|nr:cytochrome P450 [Myxococcales bacterium]
MEPLQIKAQIDGSDGSPQSPYPRWARLRASDPVHWHERAEVWVLTRHADISRALRDRRLGNQYLHKLFEKLAPQAQERFAPMQRSLQLWLLYRDPPDHTRVRSLLAQAFTHKVLQGMRPAIEETVGELLDKVAPRGGRMELIEDLAYPLPIIVTAALLGAPAGEREQFKHWADELARLLGHHRADEAKAEAAFAVWGEMNEYFRRLADERRREPRNDLISAMVAAEEQGSRLTPEELLSSCAAVLYAGSETTTHLIANSVLALLAHPEQRAWLQEDLAGRMEGAVEEFLRYDAPTQAATRIATEDLEVGGKPIRKGQGVIAMLGAANRDPEVFARPDDLLLSRSREENPHLAFSLGPHYCLGAPLARLEGQVALAALLSRFPHLRCGADRLEWLRNPTIRGVNALPLELG